ncbi:MAG: glucosaminidase domain-containing protein [Bacteroidota bacterium]
MNTNQNNNTYRQRVRPGRSPEGDPIINWAALWSRLWYFLKRLTAEVWYLFSRRQPTPRSRRAAKGKTNSWKWQPWMMPALKVSLLFGAFLYVMQCDISLTIELKAPFGDSETTAQQMSNSEQQFGFAQTVGFGKGKKKHPTQQLDFAATDVDAYLERFGQLAQAEMSKFRIPASIKMAQALLESQAGQSIAAKVDNNHFGAPLQGPSYESAWRNWREHSLLLVNRFEQLQKHGLDYRAWARGLEQAGYSHHDNYANQLLELIDRFHLEQLDDPTI